MTMHVPDSSFSPQSTASMLREGAHNSHRVRLTLLAVLAALCVNFALQTWYAHQTENNRREENALIEMAALQRMLSQRIARLALSPTLGASDGERNELRSALSRSDAEADGLAALLDARGWLAAADGAELALAWQVWLDRRAALVVEARSIADRAEAPEAPVARELARSMGTKADAALHSVQALLDAMQAQARLSHAARVRQTQLWAMLNIVILSALVVIAIAPALRSMRRQYRRLATQAMDLQLLALVAERTTNAVLIVDDRRRVTWVNQAFARIVGRPQQAAVGHDVLTLLPASADPDHLAEPLRRALASDQGGRFELHHRPAEGVEHWLDVDLQPLHDESGLVRGHIAVSADITQLKSAQADLRIAAIAFESLGGIIITDHDERILRVNAAFTRITGYTIDEARGKKSGQLLNSGRHDRAFYAAMWGALQREHHWQGEIWNRRKCGEVYPQWLSISAVRDEQQRTTHYVAVFTDISEKKRADETIHSLAYFDPLTQLPNRRLLRERIAGAIAASAATARHAALLFIDLDNFKELNDSKGHDVGDQLLLEVGRRLNAGLRADDTVARQGGDEFVVLVTRLSADERQAAAQAERIAESVRGELNRPYRLGSYRHRISPSIGISLFVGATHGVDELLKRADSAMYLAKRSGRNTFRFFDPALHAALQQRVELEAALRDALEHEQLELHFQPQVDARGRIKAAEVLLRWNHKTRGSIAPGEFIPLAEESDLIIDLGAWVLERAARQLVEWSRREGWPRIDLAVNVSARQFRRAGFATSVRDIVERTGVQAGQLKLELTESLILGDVDGAVDTMHALRRLGVKLSLDDFGTGQSSLSYLTRLPFDQIKIDQSFVRQLTQSRSHAAVVQTIIGLADRLGFEVIAEGVEAEEQRRMLESMGCRRHQGYLFGRPMPLAQFETLVGMPEPQTN